ncbi:SGNH/GDSL hydrolase family protein [Pseudomarimonas arenosa]|uniref:SGNH/GDSL hydrolase family protein n=1 Tax=Pseudomarimonas arenosa TaxID=2774145 RepID=A0AAW3ZQR1_9GAMM|nr:SGNH/GDSL hydrolase family protein [Pseudomarimonas arenosa]MBD8526964.1 SGNH/GDSL hydrolase family protein [Pseudomarimonas arenosa]
MSVLISGLAQAGQGQPIRYLALGDSYTIGEAVAESERWPMQLAAALRRDGIELATPRIIAKTGWTTDELSAAMDTAEPLGRWDLVSLLIGVNNQYRGRDLPEFEQQFEGLLLRAMALVGGHPDRLFVVTIPDWGVTPFAEGRDRSEIGKQLDAFNAAVQRIAGRHDVKVVDIAPISRLRGAEPAMVASDGLHPSGKLYTLWTERAIPVVRDLLSHR